MFKSFKGSVSAAAVAVLLAGLAVNSFAVTNQFRGVNWADKRDNFVSDALVLSGMAGIGSYDGAVTVAERVIGSFVEQLGTNSVRLPINEPTVTGSYWNTYRGVLDVALKYGRTVMGYWGPAQPAGPKDMNNWWKMWETIVKTYGDNPNAYFEIFNEPHMYSKTELRDLYAKWLEKFPDVPRDHILLDGSGMAWNVPDIADDPRFEGCLFAVHEYSFWNMSIDTEQGWMNSFKGKVGKYADRTVCTEWGGAMGPGDKAGVHYDYMDYNSKPTNYFMAYIRGMTEQLRQWQMGSFYWVGLRDGDWYSMMKRSGEGANIKLEIVNQSGVDRMHYAWTDTVEVTPVPQEPFGGKAWAIPGKIQAEDFDVPGVGKNNDSYYDKDKENHGNSDYRKDTGVDLYAKDDGRIVVGYNQKGEWLEYSVNVKKTDEYIMYASVASANETSSFVLSVDGVVATDTLMVPKGEGDGNYDDYVKVSASIQLTEGEHVLRFTVTGDWMDIDQMVFLGCNNLENCIEEIGKGIEPVNPKDSSGVEGECGLPECEIVGAVGARINGFTNANDSYNVFSVTGKFMGRMDVFGNNLNAGLKAAGFAKGVYMVRNVRGNRVQRVNVQ